MEIPENPESRPEFTCPDTQSSRTQISFERKGGPPHAVQTGERALLRTCEHWKGVAWSSGKALSHPGMCPGHRTLRWASAVLRGRVPHPCRLCCCPYKWPTVGTCFLFLLPISFQPPKGSLSFTPTVTLG